MNLHYQMNLIPLQLVTVVLVLHLVVIQYGRFDNVKTELGFQWYAEKKSLINWLGVELMPFNTMVNYGYAFVGGYWHGYFTRPGTRHTFNLVQASPQQTFQLYGEMFGLYTVMYFGIQFYRVVYHTQTSAVLDQWITPTIFAHVIIWLSRLPSDGQFAKILQSVHPLYLYSISFIGYFLTLISPIGFEVDLGIHILIAVYLAFETHFLIGNTATLKCLVKCLLCCLGFIVLKLLDLPLKDFWTPNFLSGHFLSKLCDIGQIYYTAQLLDNFYNLIKDKEKGK